LLLAKHPTVQDKLRCNLLKLDDDKRSKCEYIRSVVKESNRLVPVAAAGPVRVPGKDFPCKNQSMIIPKGCEVYFPPMLMNRNPAVFPDPKSFIPERWEDATKEMRDSVMTFACGARDCPGKSLAHAELETSIALLLADYKFEVVDEGKLDYFILLGYTGAQLKVSRIHHPLKE
jgi:cytochrome P450